MPTGKRPKIRPREGDDVLPPVTEDTPDAYAEGGPGEPPSAGAMPQQPNSTWFRLGNFGFVSWQSDNPIAVLALIMLAVLVLCEVLLGFASIGSIGLIEPMKFIAQSMIAIVGAIIGAGATTGRRR